MSEDYPNCVVGFVVFGFGAVFMLVMYILEVVRHKDFFNMFLFGIFLCGSMSWTYYGFIKKIKEWRRIKSTIPQMNFGYDVDIPQMLKKK